jgi:hypothetical protein
VRLGYVMELVVAAALCFALIRWELALASYPSAGSPSPSRWIRLLGGSLLGALTVTGTVGLALETARGRRPASWGLGRWIWAIAGLSLVLDMACLLAANLVQRLAFSGVPMSPFLVMMRGVAERTSIHHFFGSIGWSFAALCATAMVARTPRDDEPDAREWAGRLFASLVVAVNIAEPLLRAAGQ